MAIITRRSHGIFYSVCPLLWGRRSEKKRRPMQGLHPLHCHGGCSRRKSVASGVLVRWPSCTDKHPRTHYIESGVAGMLPSSREFCRPQGPHCQAHMRGRLSIDSRLAVQGIRVHVARSCMGKRCFSCIVIFLHEVYLLFVKLRFECDLGAQVR